MWILTPSSRTSLRIFALWWRVAHLYRGLRGLLVGTGNPFVSFISEIGCVFSRGNLGVISGSALTCIFYFLLLDRRMSPILLQDLMFVSLKVRKNIAGM
jgi:hypothetical protein